MTAPVATQAIAAFRERVTDAKLRSHERLVWIEDRLATTKVVNARVRASAAPYRGKALQQTQPARSGALPPPVRG
jgi:hypothetical protein